MEFAAFFDKTWLTRMAGPLSNAFDEEQLEEIYMLIDDAAFERISQKLNIDIFADDTEEESVDPDWDMNTAEPLLKKLDSLALCSQSLVPTAY